MRDFTRVIYRQLLDAFLDAGYSFQTFSEFLHSPADKSIMLRHDVDARKLHSLAFARIQAEKGIVGTYYFRIVPQSFDEAVMRAIHTLGHEIGYHYEDMDLAGGKPEKAIVLFEQHLEKIRRVAPVSTICMHGSPRSRFDNKDLWKQYRYQDYGIIGEPYFDLDFRDVFYLTDTGRRWDGQAVSVRDKVEQTFELSFSHTRDIIDSLHQKTFPKRAMLNFHPQRWTDDILLWHTDKWVQSAKNLVKYWLIRSRKTARAGSGRYHEKRRP